MTYQVGDRIRVTDTSGFDVLNPIDLLVFGAPELGEEGVVVQTDFDNYGPAIPEGGQPMFVQFDGNDGTGQPRKYGLVASEVEPVSEQVAA